MNAVFSQYLGQKVKTHPASLVRFFLQTLSIHLISQADGLSRKIAQSIVSMQVFVLNPLPSSLAVMKSMVSMLFLLEMISGRWMSTLISFTDIVSAQILYIIS